MELLVFFDWLVNFGLLSCADAGNEHYAFGRGAIEQQLTLCRPVFVQESFQLCCRYYILIHFVAIFAFRRVVQVVTRSGNDGSHIRFYFLCLFFKINCSFLTDLHALSAFVAVFVINNVFSRDSVWERDVYRLSFAQAVVKFIQDFDWAYCLTFATSITFFSDVSWFYIYFGLEVPYEAVHGAYFRVC